MEELKLNSLAVSVSARDLAQFGYNNNKQCDFASRGQPGGEPLSTRRTG